MMDEGLMLPDQALWTRSFSVTECCCWIWMGSLNQCGYGQVMYEGKNTPAGHWRLAYLNLVGPIGEGLHLDHLCEFGAA